MYCNLSEQEARSTLTTLNRSFHILTEINFFFKNAFLLTFFWFFAWLASEDESGRKLQKLFFFIKKTFFWRKRFFFEGEEKNGDHQLLRI